MICIVNMHTIMFGQTLIMPTRSCAKSALMTTHSLKAQLQTYILFMEKQIKKKMLTYLISIIEGLLVIVPALLSVAFVTIAERKTMASMQRRLGPNVVGYLGLLQAFADALKLLLKEYVAPTQANIMLFFLGPVMTLIFSLLGYLVIPFGSGIFISDYSLGLLYMLAVGSISGYGILLAG